MRTNRTPKFIILAATAALLLLTVACSPPTPVGGNLGPIPRLPEPVNPPVEYGASVDEWDEATQGQNSPGHRTAADDTVTARESTLDETYTLDNITYQQILWDALVPADFSAEAIMAKYQDQLAMLPDNSPIANEIYMQMQAEFSAAPVNPEMDGALVRIPGFIAPLSYENGVIEEFLLVPYFGACIHVPPPPINQTVLVNTDEGYGISLEQSFLPVWIMGELVTDAASTPIGDAGYFINNAIVEPYVQS